MKKIWILSVAFLCIFLTACTNNMGNTNVEQGASVMYEQITAQKAKELMDTETDYIILDVREQDEFDQGHIPGAILIPYTQIEQQAKQVIPQKDKMILVYCRSGRRSKIASEVLAMLGYTNVKEFGGIIDWPYEIVK